ncbi:lipopolysaccharide biosynthesis protein [Pseudoduganella ginsengisoli]|uniref:Oligosaccharide flippase family protein n=1 Tax=Pseudoduganella ginsengisoli TaxID=1462440 RepID=A0A6L6PZX5_9BURK|nr:oligosaccharide flippase family protein [Pseudoduganella ginsengisoli]
MRNNIIIALLQKHFQLLINIGSVLVLSRLISPEETGVFSIGVAIAALTHALRDFGVGNFLIKEMEITLEKINTAFTISLAIAIVLSIVLFAIAGPVADFYAKPEVATIIGISTVGLLISPFSTISLSLMVRNQQFARMFPVSISGAICNASTAITLGWLGFGAKALAMGQLASAIIIVVVANLRGYQPGMYRISFQHWRRISQFGAHTTAFGIAEQIGQRANDLIVGKLLGFSAVGLLSRSGTLITMMQESVMQAAMPVVLSTMAEQNRKDGDVTPQLRKSLEYFTLIVWPFFIVLGIFSLDVVRVLFGEKWLAAAPYTSILCAGACFAVMSSPLSTICNATGRVDLLSRYGAIVQGTRITLIFGAALQGSLYTVALALVVADAIQSMIAYRIAHAITGISLRQIATACWRSLAVAAIVAGVSLLLSWLLPASPALRVPLIAATATVTWLASVYMVGHPVVGDLAVITKAAAARLQYRR